MLRLLLFLHLVGAIVWLGGMAFALFALRPAAAAQLQPQARLPLLAAMLGRFFLLVWICIAVLAVSGVALLRGAPPGAAPLGWHVMAGLGTLMFLVFAHLYFAPFRRLRQAVAAADWPAAATRMGQIAVLVQLNFVLGWCAIAAVVALR